LTITEKFHTKPGTGMQGIDDILEIYTLSNGSQPRRQKEAFLNDRSMQDAIIRRLEIIGEQ
jgi:uncharacterized protein with HEPN domain